MQKIRIYELAKELGVDNKVVVNRAIELGVRGKISHSNSLEADEADQIRRAVLRQAVSANRDSEKVTTKVDKVSGLANTIVEKRKGNVIRRRKADEGITSPVSVSGPTSAADALFEEAVSEEPQLIIEPEIEAAADVQFEEAPLVSEVAETNGHVAPQEVEAPLVARPTEPEAIAQPEAAAAQVEVAPVVEPAPVTKVSVPSGVRTVVIMKGQGGAVSNETAARVAALGAQPTVRPGARVLGRIELPTKKIIAKVEVKRPAAPAPAARKPATPFYDPEEEEGAKAAAKKRSKKVEISRIDLVDYEGGEGRRQRIGGKKKKQTDDVAAGDTSMKASKRVVYMNDAITVGELAKQMSLKAGEVISKLFGLGVIATINQALDKDTASIVSDEFDFVIESTSFNEQTVIKSEIKDDPAMLKVRPPVVTIMGHVDHGKTTLLDSIRSASVAEGEAGGITQHIGAYQVALEDGRKVTFLDTPGHAAFTAMRARGAQVTDIVVLVVAADDGVMPQTIEAINHAKAAKVTIAVAINKIDKPDSNPDRVKQKLAELGLQPEEWGGDTMFFPVSALKKTGIKEMLEGLLLLADVKELKGNPDRTAQGTVIECRQDKGRGTVMTVLVQNGTLKVGDVFVSGAESGRVRAMYNDLGKKIEIATPSTPVEITGTQGVPDSGDDFFVVDNEAQAREVALNRVEKKRVKEQRAIASGPISLEEFARRANDLTMTELNIILKADVHGSVEAVKAALESLSTPKVKVRVLHAAVGGVHESDVQLATASKAMIVGFGVRGEPSVLAAAENIGIQVRFYRIIYELIDDVKLSMTGLLAPLKQESPLGRAEVRNTFPAPKVGTVAGCYIVSGIAKRGGLLRLLRDNRVIHEGKAGTLRRFKDDVKEVQSGYECGVSIEGYNDIKTGDIIEFYEIKEVAATLDDK